MGKKKKEKLALNQNKGLGSALGDALKAQGFAPSKQAAPSPQPIRHENSIEFETLNKLVLRKEKKGRGGKTVTRLEGITASSKALEALAKELRKSLGCGARVEENHIILQGDVRERASQWLTRKGTKKIVQS